MAELNKPEIENAMDLALSVLEFQPRMMEVSFMWEESQPAFVQGLVLIEGVIKYLICEGEFEFKKLDADMKLHQTKFLVVDFAQEINTDNTDETQ